MRDEAALARERKLVRLLAVILLMGIPVAAGAQEKAHPSTAVAAKMRASVERFLAALPEKGRAQTARPFDDRDRTDWHYTPRSRNGISFKELTALTLVCSPLCPLCRSF